MNERNQRNPVKTAILLFCLAIFCVAGVELAYCRLMDPKLYETIVTPIRILYHDTRAQVKGYAESFDDWMTEQESARAEIAEAQRAAAQARQLRADARRQARQEAALQRAAERQKKAEDERARELLRLAREYAQLAGEPSIRDDLEMADPAVTELLTRDGQEYLTGGNLTLPYFNQGDEQWAEKPFGVDPIGRYGCGPTAMAMLVSGMTGNLITPEAMAAWTASAGYAAPHSGSYLTIVAGTAARYGLNCASIPVAGATADTLYDALSTGGVLVALMGPGHFTSGGHFILLHGTTLSGEILVADPNSRENSLAVWEPEVILSEFSGSRHEGAPLWLITPGENS
ncbi:MAG: C39 family peptidase [Oscillibacter sp.]|nr:C39 family peptidase [Oscillibacter sp.]